MKLTSKELKEKLARIRSDDAEEAATKSSSHMDSKATSLAFRITVEMVSALVVSVFLGYWIDVWLGSKPWFMIIMLFVGFAAGFLNMYKTAMGQEFKIGMNNPSKNHQEVAEKEQIDNKE